MTLIGVRTAQAVRAALPEFEAQYRQMMAHPPDPEKLQQLVEKLQNGGSVEALSEAFKLVQPSTGAAAGTPAPGPAQ
jgi:arsenate reductase-like glutaredoxin family protein